jgi:hypothetical protein
MSYSIGVANVNYGDDHIHSIFPFLLVGIIITLKNNCMKEARETVGITHSSKSVQKCVFNYLSLGMVYPTCHTDSNTEGF